MTTEIQLDGRAIEGHLIPTGNTKILLLKTSRGFLGCGYFSVETADKVGDAVAIVTGVGSFDDMLAAPVKKCSAAAAALGVACGMTGRDALKKLL